MQSLPESVRNWALAPLLGVRDAGRLMRTCRAMLGSFEGIAAASGTTVHRMRALLALRHGACPARPVAMRGPFVHLVPRGDDGFTAVAADGTMVDLPGAARKRRWSSGAGLVRCVSARGDHLAVAQGYSVHYNGESIPMACQDLPHRLHVTSKRNLLYTVHAGLRHSVVRIQRIGDFTWEYHRLHFPGEREWRVMHEPDQVRIVSLSPEGVRFRKWEHVAGSAYDTCSFTLALGSRPMDVSPVSDSGHVVVFTMDGDMHSIHVPSAARVSARAFSRKRSRSPGPACVGQMLYVHRGRLHTTRHWIDMVTLETGPRDQGVRDVVVQATHTGVLTMDGNVHVIH